MAIVTLTIRFALELAGVASFGVWAFQATQNAALATVAMVVAVVAWAAVEPKARNPLSQTERDALGTAVLVLSAVALAAAGQPVAATVLGVAVVANAAMLLAIGPGARDAFVATAGRLD